jgi:hypothetical protein
VILAVATASCGGDAGQDEQTGAAPLTAEPGAAEAADAEQHAAIQVTDGGSIRGIVRFAGTAAAVWTVNVSEDAETREATRRGIGAPR